MMTQIVVLIDLDETDGTIPGHPHSAISDFLAQRGLKQSGDWVFRGDKYVTSVTAILAVQQLSEMFSWFASNLRSVEMLTVAETVDLMPAVNSNPDDGTARNHLTSVPPIEP